MLRPLSDPNLYSFSNKTECENQNVGKKNVHASKDVRKKMGHERSENERHRDMTDAIWGMGTICRVSSVLLCESSHSKTDL